MNNLGILQNTFSTKQSSLLQSINVHFAVKSNAIDADLAKEQSENVRLQILQKTAMAALAQAKFTTWCNIKSIKVKSSICSDTEVFKH